MPWRPLPVRPLLILIAVAAAGLVAGMPAGRLAGIRAVTAPPERMRGTEVVGAVHVHTTHSDGALDVAGIVEEGRAAGLDFLLITDHNTLAAKPQEGYAGDLLLIVGTEISTDSGHILGFGFDAPEHPFSHGAKDVLRDIENLGGTAIVAHPTSPKEGLVWTDPALSGTWGIEVVNGDTQWRSAGIPRILFSGLLYPFSPQYALTRLLARPAAARLWDELLARRSTTGIVGVDAHTRLPSYETVFRVARNHVLLDAPPAGNGPRDVAAVTDALSRGRAFIGIDGIAPTDSFYFAAERDGQSWAMGDTVAPHPELKLHAGGVANPEARFHLLKDGEVVESETSGFDIPADEAGVYRVEVTLPGWPIPWIMSNPIYLIGPGENRPVSSSGFHSTSHAPAQ